MQRAVRHDEPAISGRDRRRRPGGQTNEPGRNKQKYNNTENNCQHQGPPGNDETTEQDDETTEHGEATADCCQRDNRTSSALDSSLAEKSVTFANPPSCSFQQLPPPSSSSSSHDQERCNNGDDAHIGIPKNDEYDPVTPASSFVAKIVKTFEFTNPVKTVSRKDGSLVVAPLPRTPNDGIYDNEKNKEAADSAKTLSKEDSHNAAVDPNSTATTTAIMQEMDLEIACPAKHALEGSFVDSETTVTSTSHATILDSTSPAERVSDDAVTAAELETIPTINLSSTIGGPATNYLSEDSRKFAARLYKEKQRVEQKLHGLKGKD